MRLRDYQDLINKAIPIIQAFGTSNNLELGVSDSYKFYGVQDFLKIVTIFKENKLFKDCTDIVDSIKNFSNTIENTVIVNTENRQNLINVKTDLLNSLKNLQKIINEILTPEDKNILNIKLPECYSSIDDYINFFQELKDICFPFKYLNEEITIINFDVGSEWIGIKISETCIGLFISIVDKSANLLNKMLECKKLIAEINKTKSEQNAANLKAIETTLNIIEQNNIKEVEDYKNVLIEEAIKESQFVFENNNINENEFKNHLRKSLEKIGKLLIQGMEIVPAINSKPEIKELSQKATKNIQEKRKLIIGCDNQKYLTIIDPSFKSNNISSDTVEINIEDEDII